MLGSQVEAEDALQHVFIAAHRTLTTDERPVRLKPWLYTVAGNRCTSVLRARREQVSLDDIGEPATTGLALADEVEHREDLKHVLADVARLPDDQRAALVLAELGDLSHDEIAEALGVRTDKVKALVFQARDSLMGSRRARDTDCADIREQLATLRGGALRRTPLTRHLSGCPSCRAFKDEMRTQRAALGAVLPVAPALALKGPILAAVLGSGSGGAAAAGLAAGMGGASAAGGAATGAAVSSAAASSASAVAAGSAATATVTKVLAALALTGGAVGGGVAIEQRASAPPRVERPASRTVPAAAPAALPARGPSLGSPASKASAAAAAGISRAASTRARRSAARSARAAAATLKRERVAAAKAARGASGSRPAARAKAQRARPERPAAAAKPANKPNVTRPERATTNPVPAERAPKRSETALAPKTDAQAPTAPAKVEREKVPVVEAPVTARTSAGTAGAPLDPPVP